MKDPRESSLSFKNIFKRETKLAAYIIACMTVVVMSISYALFLQVDNNTENQIVEAGDLEFTYKNGKEITTSDKEICFQPMNEEEANLYWEECGYSFSVKNTGTLMGSYNLKLVSLAGNEMTGNKLKVILKKKDEKGVLQMESGFPKPMTDANAELSESETVELELLKEAKLDKKETIEYQIQIYVDEDQFTDDDKGKSLRYQIQGTGIVHDEQPNSEDPVETLPLEEIFPNVDIDQTDENGNGLITQVRKAETSDEEILEEGFKTSELRYVGANPNNYVNFNCDETGQNCELWRIIGLVNVKTTSGEIEQRLKLIRNESIGKFSWDTSANNVNSGFGVNEWSESDLMKLLNPGYDNNKLEDYEGTQQEENANNSLYWNHGTGSCYAESLSEDESKTISCNFSETGLKEETQKYIADDIEWNTGATYHTLDNAEQYPTFHRFYFWERSTYTGKTNLSDSLELSEVYDNIERKNTWNGRVGLLYPSDFGYAFINENNEECMTVSHWTEDNICTETNWLVNTISELFTLTPIGFSSDMLEATERFNSTIWKYYEGEISGEYAKEVSEIYPVVYLTKNAKVVGETDGSMDSPYQLEFE